MDDNDGTSARDATPSDDVRVTSDAPDDGDVLDVALEDITPEQLVSGICPYCRSRLAGRLPTVLCPACHTPHHRECWGQNGGCTTYGCKGAPRRTEIIPRRTQVGESADPAPPMLQFPDARPANGRIAKAARLADMALLFSAAGGVGLLWDGGTPLVALCLVGILLADRALCAIRPYEEAAPDVGGQALRGLVLGALFLLAGIGRCVVMAAHAIGMSGE